jgi:hypothetical protein
MLSYLRDKRPQLVRLGNTFLGTEMQSSHYFLESGYLYFRSKPCRASSYLSEHVFLESPFAPSSSWESFVGLLRVIEIEIPWLSLHNRVFNERDFWYHAPVSSLSTVTSLRELRIVQCPDSRKTGERRMSKDEGQEYVNLITKYFQGRVAKGEILKMPKITLIIAGDNSE